MHFFLNDTLLDSLASLTHDSKFSICIRIVLDVEPIGNISNPKFGFPNIGK